MRRHGRIFDQGVTWADLYFMMEILSGAGGRGDGGMISLPSPRGHLSMSGDIFYCHSCRNAAGLSWAEARMLLDGV